jgi:hypothetical protein
VHLKAPRDGWQGWGAAKYILGLILRKMSKWVFQRLAINARASESHQDPYEGGYCRSDAAKCDLGLIWEKCQNRVTSNLLAQVLGPSSDRVRARAESHEAWARVKTIRIEDVVAPTSEPGGVSNSPPPSGAARRTRSACARP